MSILASITFALQFRSMRWNPAIKEREAAEERRKLAKKTATGNRNTSTVSTSDAAVQVKVESLRILMTAK